LNVWKGPRVAIRAILDTDIGTDVDDCLALALILGSPEFVLEGVTCVYGDVELRGRIVRELLTLRGRAEVPIRLGTRRPLLGLRDVYWAGHEGQGLLTEGEETAAFSTEHAVDFIVRTVMEHPGQIHLLAIGPLTNVAVAMVREPRLATNLAHLTIMGGALRGPASLGLPIAEHNIVCDPEAAQIVLASGAAMTLVPLDVTTRCSIRGDHVARLRAVGDPFHDAVAAQVARYPRFATNGATYLHDPLAAAIAIEPGLVETVPLHVAVETQGRLTSGMTVMRAPTERLPATAAVALTVDAGRAEEFIVERLVR
jgi:purine nucleosidase